MWQYFTSASNFFQISLTGLSGPTRPSNDNIQSFFTDILGASGNPGPQGEPGEKGESSGSVYTHWGRKSCSGNATTIYQGLYQASDICAFVIKLHLNKFNYHLCCQDGLISRIQSTLMSLYQGLLSSLPLSGTSFYNGIVVKWENSCELFTLIQAMARGLGLG